MKSPKKRKIPKAKRNQHLKRHESIMQNLDSLPVMRVAKQTELQVLSETMDLEMEFSFEDSNKQMDEFIKQYNFTHLDRPFIPESVVCKAYNYGELIIALKLQQVECSDWKIEITGNFFNVNTEQYEDVPYSINLNDVSYIEIFQGRPIKIDRGHGLKTRWSGLDQEIKKHFDNQGFTTDKGWYRGNTIAKFVGKCKFINIELYEEFMFIRDVLKKDNIEKFFATLDQDSIEKGRVDDRMQPIREDVTTLPTSIKSYFLKNFSVENFGQKYEVA